MSKLLPLAWFIFLGGILLAAPFMVERSVTMDFTHVLEPPAWPYLLGTDSLGRDLLSRLVCGAGISLGVSFLAVFVSIVVGTLLGALAGYRGGLMDRAVMAFVDLFLCFPVFFLILAVVAILGPSIWNIAVIIGLTSWMGTARLVRAEVLSLREREFVLAARALGAGRKHLLFQHLIPNAMGPVLVNAVLGIASAILMEAGLSFLGIGVQPPAPSWGNILTDAKATLGVAWWLALFPGLMIFFTVLSANLLGEEAQKRYHL
ncbi:MAG: ABC transporter permease [Candidatus Omnitrophica bacterium]|nr:ABC transporter permease [Candidatus Omnitrophota bacterium]